MKLHTIVLAMAMLVTACAATDPRVDHWSQVLLNSPGNFSDQLRALDALVYIGDHRAVPAVIAYGEDERGVSAIDALAYLGGDEAKQYLYQKRKELEQVPEVQHCDGSGMDDLEYAHVIAALSALGEDVDLSYLYETLLSDDKGCAAAAAGALGLVPGEKTEQVLKAYLYNSPEGMQMPRSFAAHSLVEIDADNVRLLLMDLVENDLLYLDSYTDCIDQYWMQRCGLRCLESDK